MSRTFEVWLDSGANIHSKYKEVISLEELGLSDGEFDEMSEDEKEDMFRDIAFGRSDWGWVEK